MTPSQILSFLNTSDAATPAQTTTVASKPGSSLPDSRRAYSQHVRQIMSLRCSKPPHLTPSQSLYNSLQVPQSLDTVLTVISSQPLNSFFLTQLGQAPSVLVLVALPPYSQGLLSPTSGQGS